MSNQPIFVNTRPKHRADDLNKITSAQVVSLPLLDICDLPITPSIQSQMAAWTRGDYDVVVVTSVESARRALSYLSLSDGLMLKPSTPIIAVGQATADILNNQGHQTILPKTANNEGMLQLDIIKKLPKDAKVLIWRGVGGRRLLHDTLASRGIQVDAIEWYERTMPDDLPANYQTIAPTLHHAHAIGTPIYVLISSQMAYENWCKLPHSHQNYHYLALGNRLGQIIQSHQGTYHLHILDSLLIDEIDDFILSEHKYHKCLIDQ